MIMMMTVILITITIIIFFVARYITWINVTSTTLRYERCLYINLGEGYVENQLNRKQHLRSLKCQLISENSNLYNQLKQVML